MSATMIYGFGGVRFVSGLLIAEFSTGSGTVTFTPEYQQYTNLTGGYTRRFNGWRVSLEVLLYNLDSSDAARFATLNAILNEEACDIRPRSKDSSGFLVTGCLLDSTVKFTDLAQFECGQSLTLKFVKKDLLPTLPHYPQSGEPDQQT